MLHMYSQFRLLLITTAVLVLGACSNKPEGHSYFPLQKGLEWKYSFKTVYNDESSEKELLISNIGKESIDGKDIYIRRTDSGIDYHLDVDNEGIFRKGLRTLVELKPREDKEKRFVLKFPVETGSNWRVTSEPMVLLNVFPFRQRTSGVYFPMSFRIESTNETVTVPAGTFDNCLKVIGEGMTEIFTDAVNGFNEIPILQEEWYAPDVGLIKLMRYELDGQTITISDTPAYIGGHSRLELVSFTQ